MLNSLLRPSSINIELTEVAIAAICPAPHFYSPLYWFHGHILFERGAALIFYHSLIIHCLFTVGVVTDFEVCLQVLKELMHLVQFVKVFISPGLGILELSAKWRLLHISRNLFLGITLAKAGTPRIQSVNQ